MFQQDRLVRAIGDDCGLRIRVTMFLFLYIAFSGSRGREMGVPERLLEWITDVPEKEDLEMSWGAANRHDMI